MTLESEVGHEAEDLPTVVVRDLCVRYLIRYHQAHITLRETFVRSLGARRARMRHWRQAHWALRDVSFVARQGEVLAVIGRNGSGKSTLLKSLAGIIGADGGEVRVRGKLGCLLSLGVGFNPNLTGRENIFLNGSMIGIARKVLEERCDEIIALSGLGDFIEAPVRTYSSGMNVRLGFSIAVHVSPDVLLLDEVLTAGDAEFREKTGNIIEQLCDESHTIVMASHDMELVRRVCTRALWLDGGRIAMDDEPGRVCDAYLEALHAPSQPARAFQAAPGA